MTEVTLPSASLLRILHRRPQLGDALRVVVAGHRRVLGPAAQPLGQIIRHPRLAQPRVERVPPTVLFFYASLCFSFKSVKTELNPPRDNHPFDWTGFIIKIDLLDNKNPAVLNTPTVGATTLH